MKILFANEWLGWFGGVEQNIADTVAGLRERGHHCTLAWGKRSEKDPDAYQALFDETCPCSDFAGTEGDALGEIAAGAKADVVYIHKMPTLPSMAIGNTCPRMVRMVHDHDLCCPRRHKYFFHNAHVCHHPAGWRCWLDLAFIERDRKSPMGMRFKDLASHRREMQRNTRLDRLLVGSRFMRDELAMNGFPADRVSILPPVVRMQPAREVPVAEDPNVLFVGQLIRGKGVDLLLEALARLDCPYHATIAGDGNARPGLEEQARLLGLQDKVSFLGWVPAAQVSDVYASSRLLAVPARWPEPFGMIGLEAMRHGRPIVAFAVGGIPDWLQDGENGILVAERDVEGYAAALKRLLTDRELATQMGRRGLQIVNTRYSFANYLDQLEIHLGGGTP